MERFLLYLDNLDDVYFALRFLGERRLQTLLATFILIMLATAAAATTSVPLPGAALGAAWLVLLSVLLLYRAAVLLNRNAHRARSRNFLIE